MSWFSRTECISSPSDAPIPGSRNNCLKNIHILISFFTFTKKKNLPTYSQLVLQLYFCNSGNWGYLLNTKKATLSKINGATSSVVLASWRCYHVHPCTITFQVMYNTKCCNWRIPTCTGHLGLDQCKVFLGWGRCLAPVRFHKSTGFILVTFWWVCV